MKEYDSVMNSVHFDHEYILRSGIVQIPTVQNAEVVIVEETGSKNNEDIVSESLIDGDIVDEIKKTNDKLWCKENVDSRGVSDMEESQHIKMRLKQIHQCTMYRDLNMFWTPVE